MEISSSRKIMKEQPFNLISNYNRCRETYRKSKKLLVRNEKIVMRKTGYAAKGKKG